MDSFEIPAPGDALRIEPTADFINEAGETWSGARLLALAGDMVRVLPRTPATVAVCSSSPAFICAALLGLWKLGRRPLLLDPSLRSEPEAVFKQFPEMPVLVPGGTGDSLPLASGSLRNLVPVEASQEAMIDPVWPGESETLAMFLTSGSTGEPKLVDKRTFQLFRQMAREPEWLGIPKQPHLCSLVPPFHILGCIYGLLLPLLSGGSSTFVSPTAPPEVWVRRLREAAPDAVVGVPSHYRLIANSLSGSLPQTLFLSSGAPLTPAIDEAFRSATGMSLTQIYGSTETGGVARRRGRDFWQPFPGLEWKISSDGRLMVRSPWQHQPDTWFLTDDVAEPEGEGFQLRGRVDSVVKVGGKRFSSNEIVQQAMAMPEVEQVAAVVYSRFGENAVALFVALREGSELTVSGLRSRLSAHLAPFKVPRTIMVVDTFPLLGNGKTDLQALRRMVPA